MIAGTLKCRQVVRENSSVPVVIGNRASQDVRSKASWHFSVTCSDLLDIDGADVFWSEFVHVWEPGPVDR